MLGSLGAARAGPGCRLRPLTRGRSRTLWRTSARCASRRTCREPAFGLRRPDRLSAPKGSAGAGEQQPIAGYGQASWRAGPRAPAPRSGLAAAARRSGWAGLPGRGCCLGARLGPVVAARCAGGSGVGCREARPRPGAAPASRSPGPAGPHSVPPPSAARAREGRRPWGGALRPPERGLVKALQSWGRCDPAWSVGRPSGYRGPRPRNRGFQAEGTSPIWIFFFFSSYVQRAL